MINFEDALSSDDTSLKSQFVEKYLRVLKQGEDLEYTPKVFTQPSYASKCRIVDPKELPQRKHLHTKEGLAILLHAVAHIEYSAIDLALDAVYRFGQMPYAYKIDWMVVAQDEIRHYVMLEELLNELGYSYGDFDVHSGLFDVANHTREDIIERMAIVPRYYEASGLDVNPQIIKKLHNQQKDPFVAKIIDALTTIYHEEIDHVLKGDKWFKYLCHQRGVEPHQTYREILQKYRLLDKHRPHINVQARKEAGFSCEEIINLGAKDCK
ncbi:MAG: ferritin-like domain-containing protein [Campylobacterales bacterium]|nr:ferritin-like domain-containing protein [Campylobacterales bacterium]